MRSSDIHLRAISQEIPQPLITKISLKNYLSKIPFKFPRGQWVNVKKAPSTEVGMWLRTQSIPWLLMPWLLVSPDHQQSWHYLCIFTFLLSTTDGSLCVLFVIFTCGGMTQKDLCFLRNLESKGLINYTSEASLNQHHWMPSPGHKELMIHWPYHFY